jgi:hypothetical protein
MWVRNPTAVTRRHARQSLKTARMFTSFQMHPNRRRRYRPTPKAVAALEAELDDAFYNRKRGRGCSVLIGGDDTLVWLLVGHGEPYKREESIEDARPTVTSFRPLRYDVLLYDSAIGELRVNARSEWVKTLYRTAVGRHLFGDHATFSGTEKYTLQPLRVLGADALATFGVAGIDDIKLCELHLRFDGDPWETVTRRSSDLFRLFEARQKPFPEAGRIVRAGFRVKFAESPTPRLVTIRPTNVAHYTRDDDSVRVEAWLALRGFILKPKAARDDGPEPVLDRTR